MQEVVARAAKGLGGVAQACQVGQGVGPALARDEHLAHHGFDLQGFEQAGQGALAVGFFGHLQGALQAPLHGGLDVGQDLVGEEAL